MNKAIIWISSILFVFVVGQPVFADDTQAMQGQQQGMKHRDPFHRMLSNINLTDEQKIKVQAFRKKLRDQFEENRAKMKSINTEMGNLIHSDKMDEKKLDDLIAQRTQMMAGMMKNMAIMRNQIYNMLDAKQKEQLKTMRAKWMSKAQDM